MNTSLLLLPMRLFFEYFCLAANQAWYKPLGQIHRHNYIEKVVATTDQAWSISRL